MTANPDKFLTLVAQALGVGMVHFFIFMTSVAFSIQEGGGRPVIAQTLMHVLAFPLVSLLFLVPTAFSPFRCLGDEALFIGLAALNSGAWGAAAMWAARHWKRSRRQIG